MSNSEMQRLKMYDENYVMQTVPQHLTPASYIAKLRYKLATAQGCLMGIKSAMDGDPHFKASCAMIERVLTEIEE